MEMLKARYAKWEITKKEFEDLKRDMMPPLEILNERFSKWEITKKEFDEMKKDLM